MSFATSSNAFGTRPAPTFGGFGASTANPAPGASGSSLFGGTQNTQPNGTTGLFGNTQNQSQPTQNPSPLGSFGQAQSQPQSTNIFGQPAQQQQQPQQQQNTPVFGNTNQQQQPSSNIFGQQSTSGGGLFGQPAQQQQQQQQQPQQNPFFGQSTNPTFGTQQQQPSTGSAFFGQQQQQPGSTGFGTAFGTSQAPQQPNVFGGLGASQAPTSSNNNNASQSAPFTRTTKFNDLPDEIKKILEQIDSHIQGRVHISNDLKNRALGEEIEKGTTQIRSVYKQAQDVGNTLKQDALMTDHLKMKLDQSVQDTIASTRIVEGFRNQQASGMFLKNYASFPLEYFTRVATELKEKLEWYKNTVEQIERKIVLSASRSPYSPQSITSTLQAQHATFITLANKTAELDGELEQMKGGYRELWRAKTGSKRDPFEDGLGALEIS